MGNWDARQDLNQECVRTRSSKDKLQMCLSEVIQSKSPRFAVESLAASIMQDEGSLINTREKGLEEAVDLVRYYRRQKDVPRNLRSSSSESGTVFVVVGG